MDCKWLGVYTVGAVSFSAGGKCEGGRGSMVTDWGSLEGEAKTGERVDEKGQKEKLGGRSMDCRTRKGGKVKVVKIGIRK
jgi:hypothetical protein